MPEMLKEAAMKYEISGRVQELESKAGVPGVTVSAFDKDLLFDDISLFRARFYPLVLGRSFIIRPPIHRLGAVR